LFSQLFKKQPDRAPFRFRVRAIWTKGSQLSFSEFNCRLGSKKADLKHCGIGLVSVEQQPSILNRHCATKQNGRHLSTTGQFSNVGNECLKSFLSHAKTRFIDAIYEDSDVFGLPSGVEARLRQTATQSISANWISLRQIYVNRTCQKRDLSREGRLTDSTGRGHK
jgi:hypothetical protein